MDLKLTRGDTHEIAFKLLSEDGANCILEEGDKLYFTVKRTFYCKNCILQKTLGNGISYRSSTNEYVIELEQDCTCGLEFGEYVYDIKVVINSITPKLVKTLIKGSLTFETNVTHKEDEK